MGRKNAFTLIELMVVVAIIGLLASIILLNTQKTRFLANDAQIQNLMHQLRNAAELDYQKRDNYSQVCNESDDTLRDNDDFEILEKAIEKENGQKPIRCYENADKKEFAASSPLRTDSNKSWCVESAGLSMELGCPEINLSRCQCP